MHWLIFNQVPELSVVNRTLPVNGADYLLMEVPYRIHPNLEYKIDCFLQLEDALLGYRYVPPEVDDDAIYSNQVYLLPDWVKRADDPVTLALTPSTYDYLRIYAVSTTDEGPTIEPPLAQGLILKYYGGDELLHQQIHQGPINFDWGNSPPPEIVNAGVGDNWQISVNGIFIPPSPPIQMAFYVHCPDLPGNDSQQNQDYLTLKLNQIYLYHRFLGSETMKLDDCLEIPYMGRWTEFQEFSGPQPTDFELTIRPTPQRQRYKYSLLFYQLFSEGIPPHHTSLAAPELVPASSFYHYITEVL